MTLVGPIAFSRPMQATLTFYGAAEDAAYTGKIR